MFKLENSIRGLSFSRVAFNLTIQAIKKKHKWTTLLYLKFGISHVSHLCFLLFHYFYILIQFLYKRN